MNKIGTYILEFFLCSILPPAGVLKIAYRQQKNRQALVGSGIRQLIIAGILILIFFVLIFDPTTIYNPFTYIYGASGIMAIVFGVMMILRGKRYEKYMAAVKNHNLYKVHEISSFIGLPKNVVAKDLMQMIASGFFPEFRYNLEKQILELNDFAVSQLQTKAVTCDSCGATVTVYEGRINKCEYCDEALNY